MDRAAAGIVLPTSLISSLPRPDWLTYNPETWTFLQATVESRSRKQSLDAVAVHLRDQEVAGHNFCVDSDAH